MLLRDDLFWGFFAAVSIEIQNDSHFRYTGLGATGELWSR
jgi:hypothetical protein